MIYGKNAWQNAYLNPDEVINILSNDNWDDNNIEDFINFWSNVIYINIDGMEKRTNSVFQNVFNNPNPTQDYVKDSLKTKSARWNNIEVNRVSDIIFNYMHRRNEVPEDLLHLNFQNELNNVGPVYTIWCHYLLSPLTFPPIDKYNFTAYSFITNNGIRIKVPQNFTYPFAGTDYSYFRNWFINIVRNFRGDNYSVEDVVNLDKALMSLGAFIQKVSQRYT